MGLGVAAGAALTDWLSPSGSSCSCSEPPCKGRLGQAVVTHTPFTDPGPPWTRCGGDGSGQERGGKGGGGGGAERVNRQQLLQGKAFQKQRSRRHSLLLLLLSLNSWRKCLIKIFVLLCLSEMTYDSSLSQTPNSHSICHSHPTRDTHSPRRWRGMGERTGDIKQQASHPRHPQPHGPRLPVNRMGDAGGRGRWCRSWAPGGPPPWARAALLPLHGLRMGTTPGASVSKERASGDPPS